MKNLMLEMNSRFESLLSLRQRMVDYQDQGNKQAYTRLVLLRDGYYYEIPTGSGRFLQGAGVIVDAKYYWTPFVPGRLSVMAHDIRPGRPQSITMTDEMARSFISMLSEDLTRTVRFLREMERMEKEEEAIKAECDALIAEHANEFPPLPDPSGLIFPKLETVYDENDRALPSDNRFERTQEQFPFCVQH